MSRRTKKMLSNIKRRVSIITLFAALLVVAASPGCVGSGNPAGIKTALFTDNPSIFSTSPAQLHNIESRLSFVFSPRDGFMSIDGNESPKVSPFRTPWGDPWNHKELVTNMNAILKNNGVKETEARVRMIAHAVVASGWRQNVWNYNAWGVQQGSWRGPYYAMNTVEENEDGISYMVKDAPWRAFSNWSDAVEDFHNRIRPDSRRPSYRQAYRHLHNPSRKADTAYWSALGEGNYYTAKKFTTKKFSMLCWRVREILFEIESPSNVF